MLSHYYSNHSSCICAMKRLSPLKPKLVKNPHKLSVPCVLLIAILCPGVVIIAGLLPTSFPYYDMSQAITRGDNKSLNTSIFNLSGDWAHRFWVMEEKQYLPLVFDLNRTSLSDSFEYSNTAITAVPFSKYHFLVGIRITPRPNLRWGRLCAIGILDRNKIIELANKQPSLPLDMPKEPIKSINSDFQSLMGSLSPNIEGLLTAREKYHTLLNAASDTHLLYGSYDESKIWKRQLCGIKGLSIPDVRFFFRRNQFALQACLISELSAPKVERAQHVACFSYDEYRSTPGNQDGMPISCPQLDYVFKLPDVYNVRNLVPLVESSGMQFQSTDEDITWMMDTMGSASHGPTLFQILIRDAESKSDIESQHSLSEGKPLRDCETMDGWRGNTPVVRFTEHLWITIVHKFARTERNELNPIGRIYKNKVVLFEADFAGDLPNQCIKVGPEATDRDIFQRERGLDFEWPFAFVLGLVHVGTIETYMEGERHQFLLSAGLDDNQPALKVIDIFVPQAVLRR
jgi:hypothetical protein